MADKSKTRKIKRRLAYLYFPLIFTVLGILLVRFVFTTAYPAYKNYMLMAFGSPPSFSEQIDKKSFSAYEGGEKKSFNNTAVNIPALNQQYAEIVCDELDIEAPVFWGDTQLTLDSGVGTYTASALPGYGSAVLMSAHNTTYFKGLKNASSGDVFKITTTYGEFEYVVRETKILSESDASAFNFNSQKEELVLYTCYPFAPMSAVSGERLFVYCDKLSGPVVKNAEVDL